VTRRHPSERLGEADESVEAVVILRHQQDRANHALPRDRLDPPALDPLEALVLDENRPFELLERGTRLDPQLLDKGLACLVEDLERFRLTSRPVERKHESCAQPLAQRMLAHERFELRHEGVVPAAGELGLQELLDGRQTQLLEPGDRALGERFVGEFGERGAPPQAEGLLELGDSELDRAVGQASPRVGREPLEPRQVELVLGHPEHVAGRFGDEPVTVGAELLA
jgi:hypothetical protein